MTNGQVIFLVLAQGLFTLILFTGFKRHLKIQFSLYKHKFNQIMATQAELAQQLRDITAQNEKSRTEILGKIADLEAALAAAGNTSPEVDEAVAALKASVQTDDDIVPDAPTP